MQNGHSPNASSYAGVEIPSGLCFSCFITQQRHFYPYWIYCRHAQLLAVVDSEKEWSTYDCREDELAGRVRKELGAAA
jgi:hypothetical protein